MSANDPAATDTAAIIQGLRDELQNFENIRLQNERQNEENLNSVSIIIPTQDSRTSRSWDRPVLIGPRFSNFSWYESVFDFSKFSRLGPVRS